MRSAFKHALTIAAFLALTCGVRAEDEPSSYVVVKVTDPTHAPIAGAEVRIDRPTDSIHPVFQANANGQFTADLRPGSYDLEVRSPGFRSYKKRLHIEPSHGQIVEVSLYVGGCPECLEVTAAPAGEFEPEAPIASPPYSSLPAECRGEFDKTGIPLFFLSKRASAMASPSRPTISYIRSRSLFIFGSTMQRIRPSRWGRVPCSKAGIFTYGAALTNACPSVGISKPGALGRKRCGAPRISKSGSRLTPAQPSANLTWMKCIVLFPASTPLDSAFRARVHLSEKV